VKKAKKEKLGCGKSWRSHKKQGERGTLQKKKEGTQGGVNWRQPPCKRSNERKKIKGTFQ